MVQVLTLWDIDRLNKWIRNEAGKESHELVIVLAKFDQPVVNQVALAVKGSNANTLKKTTMVKQASNSVHSYLFNKWRIGQTSVTADNILKAIQPLNADTIPGQKLALDEFKNMLSVLEAEILEDQSIDVDNLKVQSCVDMIIDKLSNRIDEFFHAYDLWQRRVPTTDTQIHNLI